MFVDNEIMEKQQQIEELVAEKKFGTARSLLETMNAPDIALLFGEIPREELPILFRILPKELAAETFVEMDADEQELLIAAFSDRELAEVINELYVDDAVDIIQELDEEEREEILSHIDDVEQAGDIIDLLKYDEDTAGGIMGKEMIVVNQEWSMPECIKQMRMQAEEIDELYNIYVVDNDNRLKGIFPLKTMITHPSVSKIKHVMETDPVSVKDDTPIEDVAHDFEKYDLVAHVREIGAYLAEELTKAGVLSINFHKTIYITTPEIASTGQLVFRDNIQPMIKGKNVLLLMASATTGQTLAKAIQALNYYGASISGISAIFSAANSSMGIPINSLFTIKDIPDYKAYAPEGCSLCRDKKPIDAFANAYGYSSL